MATPSFNGLRVLAFESRREKEIAALIETYGGVCQSAPALREVPLESNTAALDFAAALVRREFDAVILLTGVGARHLMTIVEHAQLRDDFLTALRDTRIVVRGPKPMAVLRDWQVPAWAMVPEPNTWRELLETLDARASELPLNGARVAVQEYGVSNPELLSGLTGRGAKVTRVPVYLWQLPSDTAPLRHAATALSRGEIDVVLVTAAVQIAHLWQIGTEMHIENDMRRHMDQKVIASIGPTSSEEIERHGLHADFEASHPKMGILVREAAEQSAEILARKLRG